MFQHHSSVRALLAAALLTVLCLVGGAMRTNAVTAIAHNGSLSCALQQHIILYTPVGAHPPTGQADVTSTLYTEGGQDYVVYEGNPIAVVLDEDNGNVYDLSNNVIGYLSGF